MKKLLLSVVVLFLAITVSSAQVLISITPSAGLRGQNINTVVTAAGYFFTMGSGPQGFGDFYMNQGGTNIYPNSIMVLDDDHLDVSWSIGANVPIGNYAVQWDSWWPGFPTTYTIPGGFDIGDAFITGKVFWDSDSSLTQNGTENGMFNQKMLLLPDSAYTFTNTNGNYALGTTYGNKTAKVLPGMLWNVTTSPSQAVNVINPIMPGYDFGLKGITDYYSIDISITSVLVPRCWRPVTYMLTYTNTGTVTTHGEVKYILPSGITFDSATPAASNVVGNTYTWVYTDLMPGETRNIIIVVTLPGPGNSFTSSVLGNAQNPLNAIVAQDEAFINQTVMCAMDPNDKSVIPEGVQVPHYTLMTDSLDFVIRFQNTGNDTAFQVVILDTLNTNVLDISTFQLIAYSHPVVVDLRTNGKLTLTFDNILLPDSNVNEMGSHGAVRFRCMAKTGLPNNTVLNNTSYIYFDFNAPVVTNTTLNTLVYTIPVGISEVPSSPAVSVMPNPVNEDAIFSLPDAGEAFDLKIYDSAGRLIYDKIVSGQKVVVPAKMLKQGVLFYRVRSLSGKHDHSGKFVVM